MLLLLVLPALFAARAPLWAAPQKMKARPTFDSRIAALQAKIRRARVFSAYDELIGIHTQNGNFDLAVRLENEQAALYRAKKLRDASIIHFNRAKALQTQLQVFAEVPTSAKNVGKLFTGAALEPVVGCYLGAFIDRDDSLGPVFRDDNFQSHRAPEQFLVATGKSPGSLFMYLRYGQAFPRVWVSRLKAAGVVPHIAWEPTNLSQVRDDKYLRNFALAAREADWPVFIRFASEMNGFWTPYHGNPALYKQKFRLVNRVLHEEAPRIAMIWCVNNPPLGNALSYYPGDDGCDWVGVNFYAVPFHENRRDKPAFDENPLALLDPIYARFAAKKPIAICEFAASHQSFGNGRDFSAFASEKLSLLYGALPLLYPRVKMVNWFDMNTIAHVTRGKARNNFLLTRPIILQNWRAATNSAHYLSSYLRLGDALPPVARPLNNLKLRGRVRLRVWAKTYGGASQLKVLLDGKAIYRAQKFGAHAFDVDFSRFGSGRHTLTAQLFDARGRLQRTQNQVFTVAK
ncbi:Glycosyl hydrolase family 26 [Abditibacterium utsteinense]|uniref:Glycosyl hydrolase family 26 n=1 Tax=Abditibacterium utsteinense TaxID=1960156 RepID=A0A2S8STT1_9BACT|nr:Glycosyl hydrolase family 26 [Abditibacterium utsteinense]